MSDAPDRHPAFAKSLYLLSATFFFLFMGAGAQQAYLVRYLGRVTGWPRLQCSTIIAAVYMSMVVFRVANLYLFRNWSDRRFTIVGSLTYLSFTLAMLLVGYWPCYALALAAAVVWGIGAALMWTGTVMQTLRITDAAGGRHGAGTGILYASTHAGWLTGAIVLGRVYESLSTESLPLLYVVAAAITLVGNVLAFLLPATGKAVRETPSLSGLFEILLRPRAMISGALQFMSALAYGLILGVFGNYIGETYGERWVWISVSLYPATRMVMSFVGGHLTDRIGQVRVLVGGFSVGALGLLLTVLWRSPYAVVVTGFALGLLSSTVPVVATAIVGDAADRKRRPLAYGIIFSWRDLGVVVAAVGANLLGLELGLTSAFGAFVWVFAGCAVLSLYLGRFAEQKL